jgi:BASS family bile acid:Na+ symporter
LSWVANVSLLIVIVLVIVTHLPSILRVFGTGAVGAGILFTALAGLTGRLLGGSGIPTRKVMVLGTGFRNIAAALAVGEEDFQDPQVIVMLVIVAFAGLLLLIPITLAWGRYTRTGPALPN